MANNQQVGAIFYASLISLDERLTNVSLSVDQLERFGAIVGALRSSDDQTQFYWQTMKVFVDNGVQLVDLENFSFPQGSDIDVDSLSLIFSTLKNVWQDSFMRGEMSKEKFISNNATLDNFLSKTFFNFLEAANSCP